LSLSAQFAWKSWHSHPATWRICISCHQQP